ncbi:MAG: MFS transporter [Gammaproteobacteria bacterium]
MSRNSETSSAAGAEALEGPGGKFGWVRLAPGVSHWNMWVFLYASFATIGLLTFVTVGTPYVLTANLGVPIGEQGTVVGDLTLWSEVALLMVFGPVGVLADRIGRRGVYVIGLTVMGLAYALYPFASSIPELTVYRMIYAAGVAAATGMLGTLVADYPYNPDRGKMVALGGTLNGLGVICVVVVLGGLMKSFVAGGADALDAGRLAHFAIAGLCLLSAVIVAIGVRKGTPAPREMRPPVRELVSSIFLEVRNPRIALAFACAFIARADLVILGTFSTLWGTTAALNDGMDISHAVATSARMTFGTASLAGLIWLPIMGIILDRINRVTGTFLCMSLTAIGFLATLAIDDPVARESQIIWVLVGIGNISAFIGAMTLVSAEAPITKRGVIIGMFNIMGVFGIFICSAIGGRLFDAWSPAGPFVLIGALSAIVAVAALLVRIYAPGPAVVGRTKKASIGH